MSWSALVGEALEGSGGAETVTGLRVRPGEALARVGAHEVSLIRVVWPQQEWTRVGAALASQPVFRARVQAGELPEAAARVFSLLGLDLVPTGWGDLVTTCSCDHWRGRCAHLRAVAAALGEQADVDPFVLTRWAGLDRRSLVALVRDLSTGERELPGDDNDEENSSHSREEGSGDVLAAGAITADRFSPDSFWDPIPQPPVPTLPSGIGDRVRAAAPGLVADKLPQFEAP